MMDGRRTRSIRKYANLILTYGTLSLVALFCMFPLLWGITTSFKTEINVTRFPPQWIPDPVTISSYRQVWDSMRTYLFNSSVVVLGTLIPTLMIAAHGGYAAARYEFRGKDSLLFGILSTGMIPGIAILIPLYMVTAAVGFQNTYSGLVIIYTAWLVPTTLWLLRGFFQSIPVELEEAALIDGCSHLTAFYRITAPLSQPGLAAAAIVAFIFVWNEFIIALTLTTENVMRLTAVGLYFYITAYGIEWGKLMAAVTLAVVPILVAFILLQRRFVEGLTAGATKS